MSLNIGIEVTAPSDYGHPIARSIIPTGSDEDIEERFWSYLHTRLPGTTECYGGGWVGREVKPSEDPIELPALVFDFDVNVYRYGQYLADAGYTIADLYVAIFAFVAHEFGIGEGERDVTMRVYWS